MKEYMNPHDYCLRSLSDILDYCFGKTVGAERCERMLDKLTEVSINYERINEPDDVETEHFRNLRNAWYHECAMSGSEEAMAWKIIKAYYVVLCSISAMVRSHVQNITEPSHKKMLRLYTDYFLCHNIRRKLLFHPTNIYLEHDLVGTDPKGLDDPYWISRYTRVKNGLEWAKNWPYLGGLRVFGVPHYLLALREWVNYEDAYLFFMLYGRNPKERLVRSLSGITASYLTQAEFYMIQRCGWDAVNLQFTTFTHQLNDKQRSSSPELENRFDVYSHAFS